MRVRLDGTNDRLVVEHYNGSSWVATVNTGTTNISQYYWNHFACGWYWNYNRCRLNGTDTSSTTSWTPQNPAGQNIYIGSDSSGTYQANAQIAAFTLFDTFLTSEQQYQLYLTRGKFEDFYRTDLARLVDGASTSALEGSLYLTGNFRSGLGSASSPAYSFSSDTNTGFYSPTADTLGLVVGGVEALRIDSSGYLGVGTTAPAEELDVRGDATLSGTLSLGPNIPGYAGECNTSSAGKIYFNGVENKFYYCNGTVSYTHLTLPTNREV